MMKNLTIILLFLPLGMMAQDWEIGGNPINPPDQPILGPNNDFPLRIQTNALERMRINGTANTVNPSPDLPTPINTTGFVGFNTSDPFSPIHIAGENPSAFLGGYRNWMHTGLLISDFTDNMYFACFIHQNTQLSYRRLIDRGKWLDFEKANFLKIECFLIYFHASTSLRTS